MYLRQGLKCPKKYNPADYFIKQLAIMPAQREECLQKVTRINEAFAGSRFYSELVGEIHELEKNAEKQKTVDTPTSVPQHSYAASRWTQLRWLMWRDYKNQLRNPEEIRVHFFQSIVMALIFGLSYLSTKINQDGIQSLNGAIFFIISELSFTACNVIISNIPAELPAFYSESSSRVYSTFSYYSAKTLMEVKKH